MKFDWKAVVATVAPHLATALGGPLAGLATKTIVEAMGLPEGSTEAEVETAVKNATPEQLLALKESNNRFKIKMQELAVNLEEIRYKNVQGARDMMLKSRAKTPAILSWVVVVATIGLEGGLLYFGMPVNVPEVVVGRILGTFDTALGIVLTFWLGAAFRDPANRQTQV